MSIVPRFEYDPAAGHLYVQLADHLAARITFGEISAGTWLPTERDLAAEYSVSLDTVRRAVRVLRDWRMVQAAPPAKGAVVSQLHE